MKNNSDLNEKEMDAFAEASVQYNIERQLRNKYNKILSTNKKKAYSPVIQLPMIAKVAAAVVALVGCIFLIQNITTSHSPETLAQNFFDQTIIPGNPNITRKGATTVHQLRREANDAFTLKKYSESISKYQEIVASQKSTSLDEFYLGVSLFKTNDYSGAIEIFKSLKSKEQIDIEVVNWLLSLAFVLSDQEEKSVPILHEIIAGNNYKSQEAKKLLEAIR